MAAYDPYYADVVLLLRGNGTNDSQTITDERGHTVTVTGNTCIKTATKKYGSGSIYFDGSGDYLSIAPEDFVFGTGDFTIETWVNTEDVSKALIYNPYAGPSTNWALDILANGKLRFYADYVTDFSTSIILPLDQWVHVAICRSGTTFRLYINGTKYGQGTASGSVGQTAGNLIIGSPSFNGYLDDVRITKYARYTGNTYRVPAFEAPIDNVPPDITLTSITPHKGPTSGGTLVTLAGSGFTDYTTCTIDGNSLTSLITVSDTELTGYTPPGTVGLKDVVVTNP